MLRHIECLEAVVVCFYLRTFCDLKAHSEENFLDIVEGNCEWVKLADLLLCSGHCNIERFSFELLLCKLRFESLHTVCDVLFDIGTNLVRKLSDNGAFLCGKSAHLL